MGLKNNTAIFVVSLFVYSCNTKPNLHYSTNRERYNEAINCVLSNYASIFSSIGTKDPADIYNAGRVNNNFCNIFFETLEKQSLNIVVCYRDSTVWFYSTLNKSIKSRQAILVFAKDRKKLNEKLTSDMKILRVNDRNWYELERVISVAN